MGRAVCGHVLDGQIHLYSISLDSQVGRLTDLEAILDQAERARSGRFYLERDRRRFVTGRGLLRLLLGCYWAVEPAQIRFSYNPFGKPWQPSV